MTITVNPDSCTKCGVCSTVCPVSIISPATDEDLPFIPVEKISSCISCGHCEAFCQAGALIQAQQSKTASKAWKGTDFSSDLLGTYLKSRRSTRHFKEEPVSRETITAILDIARYAASGSNRQPVEWLVTRDPNEVQAVGSLTIEWMRSLRGTNHPLSSYVSSLITAWDAGVDVICHNAPHLLIPHIPIENPVARTDAIIALTHADITAPVFGLGTCWAGFAAMASQDYVPLLKLFDLPVGRVPAYVMMFGYPKYKPAFIPSRKPLTITWHE